MTNGLLDKHDTLELRGFAFDRTADFSSRFIAGPDPNLA
jgi:hypothetical protein